MSINNKIIRFAFNLFILIIFFGIADLVIGKILRHFYFRQQSGLNYRATYAIDSTTAEIIIFGSSRANHHYVPKVFVDSLGMSFYNCGREGSFLLYNYAIFKAVVTRYNPRFIIFDINPGELIYDGTEYDRLSSLLPYYKAHPEIRNIIDLKSPFEKLKLLSEIYPYNSSLLTIAAGYTQKKKKEDYKGYIPLYGEIKDTLKSIIEYPDGKLDTNKVNAVSELVQYCENNNIYLIFICSPLYGFVQNTPTIKYFNDLQEELAAPFWSYQNKREFISKPELFFDQYHLNDSGATYFSTKIVTEIQRYINLKQNSAYDF